MSKNIKAVVLGFENCDDFRVNFNDIGEFYLGDFEESYTREALNWIGKSKVSKKFYIQIHKDADTNENRNINFIDMTSPFERILKHADIAQVVLIYEDDSEESFYVQWDGNDEYINDNQKAVGNEKTGEMYIVIGENLSIDDVFDIESEDDFMWEMIRA